MSPVNSYFFKACIIYSWLSLDNEAMVRTLLIISKKLLWFCHSWASADLACNSKKIKENSLFSVPSNSYL